MRGRRCNIIILNVHTPSEEKVMVQRYFSEELEQNFRHFPKCHIKLLLEDFIEKMESEYFQTEN